MAACEESWKSAYEMSRSEEYLTTGCSRLDAALGGGISRRGITQIYGAAGTGKSQIALQLCLSVQLPRAMGGRGAGAVYVSTESVFPARRLHQLLRHSPLVTDDPSRSVSGDGIFVERVFQIGELESCLSERIPRLTEVRDIGLVVVDSIAAPYRCEYKEGETKNRAKSLRRVARSLHDLCRNYEMSVVCVNQVSAAIENSGGPNVCNGALPTLGITWSNLVTESYCLARHEDEARPQLRRLYVRESPRLPRKTIAYEISESGVTAVMR